MSSKDPFQFRLIQLTWYIFYGGATSSFPVFILLLNHDLLMMKGIIAQYLILLSVFSSKLLVAT